MPDGSDHRRPAPRWPQAMTRRPHIEVIPLAGIAEDVDRHLWPGAAVTVTASPTRGPAATVDLALSLARRGRDAIPHLAARQLRDEDQLRGMLEALSSAGVREVFVVGGDAASPAGDFASSGELLEAMGRMDHGLTVGIAGYPETHPHFPDDDALRILADKEPHASYVVSQMCFDPEVLLAWVRRMRDHGVRLPVRVGIAGPTSAARLLRIGTKVGVGDSLRMLGHHRTGIRQLVGPGAWRPDRLLDELAAAFEDPACGMEGLHVYTFNAMADTARWWRETISPAGAAGATDGSSPPGPVDQSVSPDRSGRSAS